MTGRRVAAALALVAVSALVPAVLSAFPPAAAATPAAAAKPEVSRFSWLGRNWYLAGVNVPWLDWGCDFGCGTDRGVQSPSSQAALGARFAELHRLGIHVVRWWVLEGSPWQIERDESGSPTGLDPRVGADLDAALRLAARYDLYYDLVLFSAPSELPQGWLADRAQGAALAAALEPLFARHAQSRRILSWEVFNEPEWDIWNGRADAGQVRETVRSIAEAVHASSAAQVTVGAARLDGLPLWKGLGLDYYQVHWYDQMTGRACVPCTSFAAVRARYRLDRPLVVGELYAGATVDAAARWRTLYSRGYAGAWAWSLFPERTGDHLPIDLAAAGSFARDRVDVGPHA